MLTISLRPALRGLRTPRLARAFNVLAVESSADDTCASIVSSSRKILSNVVVKQHDIHEKDGGINPYTAIAAHQRNMPGAVRRALDEAGMDISQVDGIAFTRGPGIGGCLSVGSNAAKTLAAALNKPLVGVHHMQAHALTPFLTTPESELPQFPFLTLLVSGGHTLLLLATSVTRFRILATTNDESIGRSIDKVSRMLGLAWSGIGPGAALERFCASEYDLPLPNLDPLPRPMPGQLAFSFSGIHSAVERLVTARGDRSMDLPTKLALARGFQSAAIDHVQDKVLLALKWCTQHNVEVRHLVMSGGVASNMLLRQRLEDCLQKVNPSDPISLVYPPPALCTDNAAMIAWASMHRFLAEDHDDYSIDLRAKWSIEDLSTD
ncbi:peptidase M22, glycoprotease [Athelia psychrophila]|uniref:N(6)-L-threonylcarbamoyladenine synthase n=1 Tax=Athelia psychrophila TaxID=1759441 RepID=A0A166WYM1_9AGAM|nr:peptidase M22, glycoprotease [Fibularhizoctonia sp. CBS 109695]